MPTLVTPNSSPAAERTRIEPPPHEIACRPVAMPAIDHRGSKAPPPIAYMKLCDDVPALSRKKSRRWSMLVLAGAAFFNASCRDATPRARTPTIAWRPLGSWSGRGPMQTDPFLSDTGSLRLRWATRNETATGTGTFRVTVHSDVSGRSLVVAIDARGAGGDVAYVSEDPRSFFLAVESANVDWTLAADEGVAATAAPAADR